MRIKKSKNKRGFGQIEFEDLYGMQCRILKSSLATKEAIWIGAKEIGLKEFRPGIGWKDVELVSTLSHHFVANTSMHLSRSQVKKLIPILQKFADTGEV